MHSESRWLRNVPTSPKVCSATSSQPRSQVISSRTGGCPHHPRPDAVSSSSLSGIVNRFMHLDADPLHHICPLQLKLGLPCARINGRPHAVLPFLHSYHGLTTITRVSTGICLICCGTCRFIPLRQMNLQTKLRGPPRPKPLFRACWAGRDLSNMMNYDKNTTGPGMSRRNMGSPVCV